MQVSLFCRVIDNYGDAGFCLRLALELRARGHGVDFYIDDARPLTFMQAGDAMPVPALPWPEPHERPKLGELVIEAYGCELPEGVQIELGAGQGRLWVNLEYLSAEGFAERSHGLPSPVMSGPAKGRIKRFLYPGFSARTGGLLRERQLERQQASHKPAAWWQQLGRPPLAGERQLSVFAYPSLPLDALLAGLADAPTRVLWCGDALPGATCPAGVRLEALPMLNQADYDRLLWSCDLNIVRGEDSFVRAQWAARPFIWHIYPQHDGAHAAKLNAYLALRPELPAQAWRALNGLAPSHLLSAALPVLWKGEQLAQQWRDRLLAGPELVDSLLAWAAELS